MAATIPELLDAAKCYASCIPERMQLPVLIYLATQIVEGGSGEACCLSGSGSPEGVVVGSPGHTYIDTTNGYFYVKQTGTVTNTGWLALVT